MAGRPVDGAVAEVLEIETPEGAVITQLHPESPFADAGFQAGDVITHLDGKPVSTAEEMVYRMSVKGIGSTAEVRRLREGELSEVSVRMIAPPDEPPANEITLSSGTLLPGVTVARINPRIQVQHALPVGMDGVLITDLGPVGARARLARLDVLLSINGREVRDTAEVARALAATNRTIRLELLRDGRRFVIEGSR